MQKSPEIIIHWIQQAKSFTKALTDILPLDSPYLVGSFTCQRSRISPCEHSSTKNSTFLLYPTLGTQLHQTFKQDSLRSETLTRSSCLDLSGEYLTHIFDGFILLFVFLSREELSTGVSLESPILLFKFFPCHQYQRHQLRLDDRGNIPVLHLYMIEASPCSWTTPCMVERLANPMIH